MSEEDEGWRIPRETIAQRAAVSEACVLSTETSEKLEKPRGGDMESMEKKVGVEGRDGGRGGAAGEASAAEEWGMPGCHAAYVSKLFGAQCRKKKDALLLGTLGKATAEHEDMLADDDLRRCTKSTQAASVSTSPILFRAKRELAGIETELLAHALTMAVCVRMPRSRVLRLPPPPV